MVKEDSIVKVGIRKLLIPLFLIVIFAPQAFATTATISGTCYSILFDDTSFSLGSEELEIYYTTSTGILTCPPLGYDIQEPSREVKKIVNQYCTDYVTFIDGYVDDFGMIKLNLNSPDANGNGIDDVCEKSQSVNISITGNWYSCDHDSGGISGSVYRSADSQYGSYTLVITDTDAGAVPLSGCYYVLTLAGTVTYAPVDKTVSITYTVTSNTQDSSETLNSTYEIVNENTVTVAGAVVSGVTFPTMTFTRNGTLYTAEVTLPGTGGDPDTYWQDYEKWRFVIQDTNDMDGDGIPDFSDATDDTQYTITASVEGAHGTVSPTQVSVDKGGSQIFTATPETGYKVNEWKVAGVVVQTGGTSYTLSNIQDDATVVVSFSQQASIAPLLPLILND